MATETKDDFVMVKGRTSGSSGGSDDSQVVVAAEDMPTGAQEQNESTGPIIAFEPLLNQIHQWSRQLAPHLETCGAGMDQVVAPVAATLTDWSKQVEPHLAHGGEEVKKGAAKVHEALVQLLAKLEPLTAKATTAYDTAVRPAVTSAVDAIRSTLVRLAPLAEQARGNLLEWNSTQLQPWMAHTGEMIKVSSVNALENAKVKGAEAVKAAEVCYTTQVVPWAAQTGEQIQVQAAAAAKQVEAWNTTTLQPWIATTVTPVATEWWLDTLRCFCVPLASIVAMTGMKEQAAKLHAIAPEKIAAGGAYPTAANPPATEPAAVA